MPPKGSVGAGGVPGPVAELLTMIKRHMEAAQKANFDEFREWYDAEIREFRRKFEAERRKLLR